MRHGDAVHEDEAGSDRDRWLSPRGREAARVLGRLLREQQLELDALVCSPLPRAVQTAELLAHMLDYIAPIATWRCLEPSAHPRVASAEITRAGESVLVVGHEPSISAIGATLMPTVGIMPAATRGCADGSRQRHDAMWAM